MALERRRVRGVLLLGLFAASNAGYFYLDPEASRFVPWLGLYTLQFALLAAILRHGVVRISHVVFVGLVSRVVLWFSIPVLEVDYFRYLWDGHVFAEGINPYLYAPEDPALDGVETNYRFFINYSQFSTIYPPVAQYVFWLAHAMAPDSLLGLKIVLTLFDVATGLILLWWARDPVRRVSVAALYFLNPLVLKEIANSAHLDSIPVFFATAAVLWTSRKASLAAWLLLASSIGAKLYAVALAPLLARCDPGWKRHGIGAVSLLALLYVPFLDAGRQLFAGTAAFGEYWIFNASLFRVVAAAWDQVLPDAAIPPRVTVLLIFAAIVVWRTKKLRSAAELPEACVFVLGALLLLSPVVDAWYALWILPLAIVTRSVPWIAFSYLVAFSYSWFQSPEAWVYFGILEYGALFILLWRQVRSIVAP